MIDLSNKEQLFFHWLERSESDRGLNLKDGQFKLDWFKVLSKADSRLKIDEHLKFKLFDWVTNNIKEDFFESLFNKEAGKSNFVFELKLSNEVREKYKSHFKKFTQAVLAEFQNGGFKTISPEKAKLLKKEIEFLDDFKLLDFLTLESSLYVNLNVSPHWKPKIRKQAPDAKDKSIQTYFSSVSPNCFQDISSWPSRKTYSKSVVELMASLKEFYKSKSWQSMPKQNQDPVFDLAYGIVNHKNRDDVKNGEKLTWVGLNLESPDPIYNYRKAKVSFKERSDCKSVGLMVAKKVRDRVKGALTHWQYYWNIQSKSNTIPESIKQASIDLEKILEVDLDQDMELASTSYYDQSILPFDQLMDYLLRTYLPLSLFFSGVINTYQDPDGEHFLGFSQSAILHHLAQKSFGRSPGQFPLAKNGDNPFFVVSKEHNSDDDWDEDDFYDEDMDDDWDDDLDAIKLDHDDFDHLLKYFFLQK